MFVKLYITTFLVLFAGATAKAAGDIIVQQQRALFRAADKALTLGDLASYNALRADLARYPLLPYLEYKALVQRLEQTSDQEIETFLLRFSDTPLSERLRYQWLKRAAKRGDDATLIRFYRGTEDLDLECQVRASLLRAANTEKAIADFAQTWTIGSALPSSCDPVISYWQQQNLLTPELVWQRIRIATRASNSRLVSELVKLLPATAKPAALLYPRVHANPGLISDENLFSVSDPKYREIALYGLQRLAYRDLTAALSLWNALEQRFQFSPSERAQTQILMGILLAQDQREEALPWLMNVNADQETPRVREWRVRSAIFNQNWPLVLVSIGWLDEKQQAETRWRYWYARAIEKTGSKEDAQAIYAQIATLRDYHGFLAADRISRPYSFQNKPIEFTPDQLETIEHIPGLLRARELYAMNRVVDARREWEFTRQFLNDQILIGVAKLAQKWGWHSLAIATAAQSGYYDDVSMRFPLRYQDIVQTRAEHLKIEPHWIYGILRQESAFAEDARSSKGALGLMQLMPQTGRHIAKRSGAPMRHAHELLRAERNIELGSSYLHEIRARLFDHPVLATAAYNAGPQRVLRWLPKTENVEADIWIETIPYDETRDYLERVLAFTLIYDWRLDEETTALMSFMRPISPLQETKTVINEPQPDDTPKESG